MAIIPDRRALRRAYMRLMRHPGSPQRTGRGIAIGLMVAFVVPFTFHMVLALALAILLRGARFAAMLATWVVNPLTIPVLYPIQCYVGGYLTGRPLSYTSVAKWFSDVFTDPSWSSFEAFGKGLLIPFFAGGLFFGIVASVAGYYATTAMIVRFRERRAARKGPPGLGGVARKEAHNRG